MDRSASSKGTTFPIVSVFANDFLNNAVRRTVCFARYATNHNTSVSGTAVRLTSNQWYQVVCRYDGTNMDVAVNGVLAGRYAAGPVATPIRSTRNLILGGYTGVLDEVEISTLDQIPSVSLERADSRVMVRFTGTLEVGTNAAGPYQAVTQATNPYLAPISGPQRFWRTSLPGPTPSPNVAPMLQILPSYIQSALAENQALLPPVRTLRGEAITREGIDIGEPVKPESEVVVIDFPPVQAGHSTRLRISETYTDPARYQLDGDDLVWDRAFGRPFNAVVLPAGWTLTQSSIPGTISRTAAGRVRLDFVNPRNDEIQVLIVARRRG